MNSVLVFFAFIALAQRTQALTCYSCSNSNYDGESSSSRYCFTTSSFNRSCPPNTDTDLYYCRTRFILEDGMAKFIERGCVSARLDEVTVSTSMPSANKCITSLSLWSSTTVDTTDCYYHCNTSNCNDETTRTLKTCSSDCSKSLGRGACDYITGTCACIAGYTGVNCSTSPVAEAPPTIYRSCVQCNSETDTGCATSTSGSSCPANQKYCSSAKTMIYDFTTNQPLLRTIITRGCTSTWLTDECSITNIYNDDGLINRGYTEYTCYATCDTDNCNTKTPDGALNSERKNVYCQQCSSTDGNCESASTQCPSSATHCKATVAYLISQKTDSNPIDTQSYKLLSVIRECASSEVTADCTEMNATGTAYLKKVTCQETCQTDGCNSGWPARPKCSQCTTDSSDLLRDGYDACLEDPGSPQSCTYPYEKYCYTVDRGPRDGNRSYSRRIERRCSHHKNEDGCSTYKERGMTYDRCIHTCTDNGCNVGNDGPIPNLVATALLSLFGWMFAFRL